MRFVALLLILGAPVAAQTLATPVVGASGEELGWAVVWLDDVDGDGTRDWAVGGPSFVVNGLSNAGRVQVISGGSGAQILQITAPVPNTQDLFGIALAAGDVDGDGKRDLLVGASREGGGENGSVHVYSGASLATLGAGSFCTLTGTSGSGFGRAVHAVDFTQDHQAEIIVGEGGLDRISVFQYSGGTCVLRCQIQGSGYFGIYLGHADVNGDGIPDILAGSISAGVRIYSGATCLPIGGQISTTDYPRPAGIGDLNDDGFEDFAIGEPVANNVAGSVTVYSGQTFAPLAPAISSPNPSATSQFGNQVAAIGDLDDDQIPDFVVAEPFAASDGNVYILSGVPPFEVLNTIAGSAVLSTAGTSALVGVSMAADADVNGDGCNDLLLGAPRYQSYTGVAVMTSAGVLCGPAAAIVSLQPQSLKLTSNGNYVTCYISPSGSNSVTDFVASSPSIVEVNGSTLASAIPAVMNGLEDIDGDEVIETLMVKFDRALVAAVLVPGPNVLVVEGVVQGGRIFRGTAAITAKP